MEEIRDGIKIGKHETVCVIYEVDEIYYMIIGFGEKPRHSGSEVKAFKGGDEVEPAVEKMVEKLNSKSSAYQKKREEFKKENKSPLKRVRKLLTSERERRQIKRMASDKHVFGFFS